MRGEAIELARAVARSPDASKIDREYVECISMLYGMAGHQKPSEATLFGLADGFNSKPRQERDDALLLSVNMRAAIGADTFSDCDARDRARSIILDALDNPGEVDEALLDAIENFHVARADLTSLNQFAYTETVSECVEEYHRARVILRARLGGRDPWGHDGFHGLRDRVIDLAPYVTPWAARILHGCVHALVHCLRKEVLGIVDADNG